MGEGLVRDGMGGEEEREGGRAYHQVDVSGTHWVTVKEGEECACRSCGKEIRISR
jgi:hypothetical protein